MSKIVYGYDGNGYTTGERVELTPASDLWVQGARYGTVKRISTSRHGNIRVTVALDKITSQTFTGAPDSYRRIPE